MEQLVGYSVMTGVDILMVTAVLLENTVQIDILEPCHTVTVARRFSSCALKVCNSLSNKVQSASSLTSFKAELKGGAIA